MPFICLFDRDAERTDVVRREADWYGTLCLRCSHVRVGFDWPYLYFILFVL